MDNRGEWIQTYSGKRFYPFDPQINEIDIVDIAHALSVTCRFGGHCKQFYSVAEHSLLVADLCDSRYRLHALLHDASEAYLVDLPSPIKRTLRAKGIPIFDELERNIQRTIYKAFGLSDTPENVLHNDKIALEIERKQLMEHYLDWQHSVNVVNEHRDLRYLTPNEANIEFITLFNEIGA